MFLGNEGTQLIAQTIAKGWLCTNSAQTFNKKYSEDFMTSMVL